MINKEEYNLDKYYIRIPEKKKFSRKQVSIMILIHSLFIIVLPILIIDIISNLWIQLILFIVWVSTIDYTSIFIQKYISDNIFKWLKII